MIILTSISERTFGRAARNHGRRNLGHLERRCLGRKAQRANLRRMQARFWKLRNVDSLRNHSKKAFIRASIHKPHLMKGAGKRRNTNTHLRLYGQPPPSQPRVPGVGTEGLVCCVSGPSFSTARTRRGGHSGPVFCLTGSPVEQTFLPVLITGRALPPS